VADYRAGAAAAPLTDMLATNLARISGLQVVSTVRLLELIAREGGAPGAASYAAAARRAGATDLVEGGLHAVPGGLRLELRRVSLADGKLRGAWRLEGDDLFALVDSATAAFAQSLGGGASLGPGSAGTRSLVAWRFYEEGLRDFARGDFRGALGLFEAAFRDDSAFAMAAYFAARSRNSLGSDPDPAEVARLERLAMGLGDRERLQILAWAAHAFQSPVLDALADTLITLYPADIEAQFLAGFARMARAEFASALPYLHRVIAADSGAVGESGGRCLACEALQHLMYAYHALDSIPQAEQIARDWLRRDPGAAPAWAYLASLLDVTGRSEEAIEARRRADQIAGWDAVFPVGVRIRAGEFAAADQAARALIADESNADWTWLGSQALALSLRNQARWQEFDALLGERFARLSPGERAGDRGRRFRILVAIGFLESHHPVEAVRILDSLIRSPREAPEGVLARSYAPWYALLAEAAFASGNAPLAARAADSAAAWAARAAKARELGTATYARAMARLARHDTAGALDALERAIYSPTLGWIRANQQLGRLRLLRGDARGAARILRPALQGPLDIANLTEIHELLAESYDRLGMADSARVHWAWVARALEHADPADRPRHTAAVARLRAR
jgi:tetratricopeptide (TPR) repeat protein